MGGLPVSIFCPFCSRHTALTVAPATAERGSEIITTAALWQTDAGDMWWIGLCNYCKEPVLVRNAGEIIYPNPLPSPTDERIPAAIKRDLDEAKMCLSVNCYRACAVMARRAMQSACIDKGAAKDKRLVDQLDGLASSVIITKDLKEWADVVRWVGNDAAHPSAQDVTKGDAEDILRLAEQFLHIIYVAPAIAKEQRTKRGK